MKAQVISRRNFLKLSTTAAAALGIGPVLYSKTLSASVSDLDKPAVIWLEAQDCTGCTESVLSSISSDLCSLLIDTINLRYHETLMSATGEVAENALEAATASGGYILVVEGSIPTADARFLQIAGKSFESILCNVAKNSEIVLCLGSCACYGGINRLGDTSAVGVEEILTKNNISKTLINLPGCPTNPVWFFDTIQDYLMKISIPLDAYKRPLKHFYTRVHRKCERRWNKKKGLYLTDWNDPKQKDYCLLEKGCRGQFTISDCPIVKWNDGVNWCVANGAPCVGCTEPNFYADKPFYVRSNRWESEIEITPEIEPIPGLTI